MFRLVKKDVDNGNNTCKNCTWLESSETYFGFYSDGCSHPILYDDNGNIIEEINNLMIECMENPKHCCLMESKRA